MSITEGVSLDLDGLPSSPWDAPEPVMPEDWSDREDAFEDAVMEARACGDAAFVDRMHAWWWPESDAASSPQFEPPVDDGESSWVAADPVERFGPAVFLQLAGRAKNQADAAFLAAVHRAGHAEGSYDSAGSPCRDRWALPEIGAALRHSLPWAAGRLRLAEAIIERLPKLYEAMASGWLDLAKATVFVDETSAMPDDLAGMVVGRLLPRVSEWAKDELAGRISVAAGQLDHDWAQRREQAARARGRVEYRHTPAGTGDVALRDMSAAARARIQARGDALAITLRAAARRSGLALGLPALRLLASERLLDGSYAGYDDDALIRALIDELPAWYAEINGTDDDSGDDARHAEGWSDESGDDDSGDDGPGDDGPGDGGPGGGGPDDDGPGDGGPNDDARSEGVRLGTMELRLRLSTALGLDELPASIPGAGPLTAPTGRRMLADIRLDATEVPTEYRLVLTDQDGHLEHVLLVRPDAVPERPAADLPAPDRPARPRGPEPRGRAHGTVIVELAAPTTLLAALSLDDHPGWAGFLRRAQHQIASLAERGEQVGGPNHPATTLTDAHRRLPGAVLERWIRVRDRHCPGPMCTRPAHSAEIDHTRDWANHGLTVAANLGPPCTHCHALKHRGGWDLTQPEAGRFEWTSPLGGSYRVEPRPVLETPLEPSPRADGHRRPVLDVPGPPRPTSSGHVRHRARHPGFHDIPAPPTATDPAHRGPDDDPPPF